MARGAGSRFWAIAIMTSLHVWLLDELGHGQLSGANGCCGLGKECSRESELGVDLGELGRRRWAGLTSLGAVGAAGRPAGAASRGATEGMLTGGCLAIYAEASRERLMRLRRSAEWSAVSRGHRSKALPVGSHADCTFGYAGMFEGDHEALCLGHMAQSCSAEEQGTAGGGGAAQRCVDFAGPIAIGLRSGHVDAANVTLPFGVRVRLDCEDAGNPRMHFLEAAVEG